MSGPTKFISAGTQYAFWGQVDTLGFLNGTSGAVASGATGEPMGRILGIQESNPGPAASDPVDIPGDDGLMGQIEFPPNTLPKFDMSVGVGDLSMHATLQSTTVETLGDLQLNILQPNNPNYPDCCIILQAKAKSQDTGSSGTKKWYGYIMPLVSITPLGRAAFSGRQAGVDRYRVTANVPTRKPWGVTITDAVMGTTGGPIIEFTADNPIKMHRFTGTGAQLTFNLSTTDLPVSTAKTIVHVDTALKTATTDYSVNTSTGVITFVSAPANNSKIVVLYEIAA